MKRWLLQIAMLTGGIAAIGASIQPSAAQIVELQDGNSSVRLNFTPATGSSIEILELTNEDDEWRVEGIDNLFVEDFFFGFAGRSDQAALSLGSFSLLSFEQTSANRASLLFENASEQLQVRFDTFLEGGAVGSNVSTRRETLTLYNLNPEDPLELSFFKYFDFDVLGSAGAGEYANDTTQFINGKTLLQTDPSGVEMLLTSQQTPDRVALAEYPDLLKIFTQTPDANLDNDRTRLENTDGTAALQFNRIIGGGSSVSFDFSMQFRPTAPVNTVPEPTAVLGFTLVTAGYLLRTRRQIRG